MVRSVYVYYVYMFSAYGEPVGFCVDAFYIFAGASVGVQSRGEFVTRARDVLKQSKYLRAHLKQIVSTALRNDKYLTFKRT